MDNLDLSSKPFLDIDFEFFGTNEYRPTVVCGSVTDFATGVTQTFWTLDPAEKKAMVAYLYDRKETHIFRGYMCIAEARAFLAMDVEDVKEFLWVDLYPEWLMIKNHNDAMGYGKQMIDGRLMTTYPPVAKWEETPAYKKKNKTKAGNSLASCCYKMLGEIVDTAHKDKMRDIIISGDLDLIEENKEDIIAYCESDIKYLDRIYTRMRKEYKRLYNKKDFRGLLSDMLWRGNYSVRTAYIERLGESINIPWARNFARSVPMILKDIQRDINSMFPEITPFRYNKREKKYEWNQVKTREWIKTLPPDMAKNWKKTKGKDLSLSLEAFEKFFAVRHTFSTTCLGQQFVRYLRLKQSLNGFLPAKKGKRNFFDTIGSDNRARPFLGIFGSQSGRNQPSSTGFLFLKSAWMRALSEPAEGKIAVDIDFGSEEFLAGGLDSGDRNMIEAYHSGDPYLWFAKAAGAVPQEGTKQSHPEMRNLFKSTCLAEGTLIHTDNGLKEIQDITDKDLVWDGENYVTTWGAKYMGRKEVMEVESLRATADHKILTEEGWVRNDETEKENRCYKNARRLPRPSASWSDVWKMVNCVSRSYLIQTYEWWKGQIKSLFSLQK